MPEEVSWSEVSSTFSEVFPKTRPTNWKIAHLIFHNYLSKSGDVRRTVEISLQSAIDSLEDYEWRIPLPTSKQNKVHGLSVRDGVGELLKYDLTYYRKDGQVELNNPDFALLKVSFPPLAKGDTKTIRIEYFVECYAIKEKKGFFSNLWKYSWSYRVHSETRKFEHRVVIPDKCEIVKNGFATNMPSPPLNFSYGDKETMIWMADNPNVGDFIGEVKYRQESPIGLTAIGLAGGAFIGALTTLVTGVLSALTAILIFVSPIIGVFVTIYLSRKLLPTQR